MSARVAVLMSTWNGAEYLHDQMDSVLGQEDVDFEVFVRDDGSTDETKEIVALYEKEDTRVHFIDQESDVNLGTRDSFFRTLRFVYESRSDIQYFAFCDQDDFWKPEKLSAAVEKLQIGSNQKRGSLYYSNKTFVNSSLMLLREERIRFYDDFFETLWPSLAYGCTMVFDRKLAGYALRWTPDFKYLHDAWVYRVGKAIGSRVIFDEQSHILYRQHNDNQIGMDEAKTAHGILYMIKNFVPKLIQKKKERHFQKIMIAIDDHFTPEIDDSGNREWMDALRRYPGSWKAKGKLILARDMLKRGPLLYSVWCYKILLGYI